MTAAPDQRHEPILRTQRLHLRLWREADLAPFAALNADPVVMEFLPNLLTRADSDALAARLQAAIDTLGFEFWAIELRGSGQFAGFTGLSGPRSEAPFTPCVELGWRLARGFWGQGYATEAAHAAVAFGFETLALAEIVAFTVPANLRSRRVMERLGMQRDAAADFEHPALPAGHLLRPHLLYRLRAPRACP